MIIGIPKESGAGERRVAFTPENVEYWTKKGTSILVQADAGLAAGFLDQDYQQAGATIVNDRADLFRQADMILQVQAAGTAGMESDMELLRPGQLIAGMMEQVVYQRTFGVNTVQLLL